MNDFPTTREELDRKSFETINWLSESLAAGRITMQEFSTALDAVFMSIAGLVSEQTMELFNEVSKMVKPVPAVIKRVFLSRGVHVIVTWVAGESEIQVNMIGIVESRLKKHTFNTAGIAFAEYEVFCANLLVGGAKEL